MAGRPTSGVGDRSSYTGLLYIGSGNQAQVSPAQKATSCVPSPLLCFLEHSCFVIQVGLELSNEHRLAQSSRLSLLSAGCVLPYSAMLHYFRTRKRGEKRGQEGKEGRSEDGREKELKCQEDEDTEKKRRKHRHTHKIKHLLC